MGPGWTALVSIFLGAAIALGGMALGVWLAERLRDKNNG